MKMKLFAGAVGLVLAALVIFKVNTRNASVNAEAVDTSNVTTQESNTGCKCNPCTCNPCNCNPCSDPACPKSAGNTPVQ